MAEQTAIVHSASELVVGPDGDGGLETIEGGAFVAEDGQVISVGATHSVLRDYPAESADTTIDATGQTVLPGFVDPHTHALFTGDRSDEFAMKLRGKSYQDILAEGGGILRTVRAVRAASDEELRANLREHLDVMLANGTTSVEVKSGYGLDTETELRMLDAIGTVTESHPVDVVATYMGAHAVPDETDTAAYVDEVVTEQIPAVAEQGVAEFCDVFCEDGVFDVDESRRILEAGKDHGLTPKIHADEFVRLGGSQLAVDVGAASADHLLQSSPADVDAIAASDVTPVLLPGTAFGLGEKYADAAAFRDAGAKVALATDFNPNCFARSQGFTATLACVGMRLPPATAIAGITAHAAAAIDRPDRGTLREGAKADAVVLDAPSHVHLPYHFDTNPIATVVTDGEVAYE